MTASLSFRSSMIGEGRTRDVSQQQVLDSAMAGKRDGTTTTTALEEECTNEDDWRKLYDDVDDGDDNDVFVNDFSDDVGCMFSDVERSASKCFHSKHLLRLFNNFDPLIKKKIFIWLKQ